MLIYLQLQCHRAYKSLVKNHCRLRSYIKLIVKRKMTFPRRRASMEKNTENAEVTQCICPVTNRHSVFGDISDSYILIFKKNSSRASICKADSCSYH